MLGRPLSRWGAVLIVGLLVALVPLLPAAAQSPSGTPKKVRVEITDNGFNDKHDYSAEVQQGDLVELTFAFAQTHALGDNHIFVLKGYGLETPEVNAQNKEATLKFVADKPGTFDFACDIDCEIHDKLQRGQLKVTRGAAGSPGGAGAPSAALNKTTLALYPSTWAVDKDPVKVVATLKDSGGAPVAKAMVRFFVEAEFAGTKGQMEVGAAKTDAAGGASITYKPTAVGPQQITARFEGMGLYAESQQAIQLLVTRANPAYTVAPRGLELLRAIAPRLLILVLVAIWSTFAFVLYQVFRIKRPRRLAEEVVVETGRAPASPRPVSES